MRPDRRQSNARRDGRAVVVGHDRWFLDRVATHIFFLRGGGYIPWVLGKYMEYLEDLHKRKGLAVGQLHRLKHRLKGDRFK